MSGRVSGTTERISEEIKSFQKKFIKNHVLTANVRKYFLYYVYILVWPKKLMTIDNKCHLLPANTSFFFKKKKLGFTPCKAKQPLRGLELQESKHKKKITGYRKSV